MNVAQNYKLRKFKPENPVEIERMNLMFYHPQVIKFMGYDEAKIGKVKKGDLQKLDKRMFGSESEVSKAYQDVSYAVADEQNNLVGWIWFSVDRRHPLPKLVAKRFGLNSSNYRAYQVVYEKLLSGGWPIEILTNTIHVNHVDLHKERKGVIVEGLKLAISRLSREYRKVYAKRRTLALYAYVLPDNIASQKVLEKNEFTKEDRQYRYDGLIHDLWVRILR